MDRNNPPTATEGSLREKLAAYFLTAPPYEEQSAEQRREYLSHLQQLGQLEDQEVLQAVGTARPLVWGNPVPLLQSLLTAAQRLAAGVGQPLLLFPAKETVINFQTLLHPRLLSLAMVDLLRTACLATPRQPVWVRIQEQSSCLTVSVTAAAPFADTTAFAVAKESARLHSGSLALCDLSVGFSCGRVTEPSADVRPYRSPSADELLRDTLSAVWTGFYSWLSASSATDPSTETSDDNTSDT